jgi:hypothetical protein
VHRCRHWRRRCGNARTVAAGMVASLITWAPLTHCPAWTPLLPLIRSTIAPNVRSARHIPAHRAWGAYCRERRTPLISEVPDYSRHNPQQIKKHRDDRSPRQTKTGPKNSDRGPHWEEGEHGSWNA